MFSKKSTKAMSQIVTTILLIALVLVAIGIVWLIINKILDTSKEFVEEEQLSIYSKMRLQIESAQFNEDLDKIFVQVQRSAGQGNLEKIVFIVGDETISKSVERNAELNELEKKIFIFDLEQFDISAESAKEVSIAPVTLYQGEETTGEIMDTEDIKMVSIEDSMTYCTTNPECGIDEWILGTEYCDDNKVLQAFKTHTCQAQSCKSQSTHIERYNCSAQSQICYAGECIDTLPDCSKDEDCEEDKWIPGTGYCDEETIWKIFAEYFCNETNKCQETIINKFKEDCELTEKICSKGECFIELECFTHSDCGVGKMCKNNICVPEYVVNEGTIYSVWPSLGDAEFFDSLALPKSDTSYLNYFVKFTGEESRCLTITNHVPATSPDYNSYIQLNSTSKIKTNDNYYIWETLWGCTN